MSADSRSRVVAVSLKMYLGHAATLRWCAAVGEIASRHPAVVDGHVELVVLPTHPAIVPARTVLGHNVSLGAQDLATHDPGAFTGEVSGTELAEIGCSFVEVGHAERRHHQHETDETVAMKLAAAVRNDLVPIVCVGEPERTNPEDAAESVLRELERLLALARLDRRPPRLVVAYEPHWSIGRSEAAPLAHITTVSRRVKQHLAGEPHQVIYGGSAGPGLLAQLHTSVDGLFLGRFAHDPGKLESVLDEALRVSEVPA